MSDSEIAASMYARLESIQAGQAELRESVAELAKAMTALATLEVKLSYNSQAVERSFASIDKVALAVDTMRNTFELRVSSLERTEAMASASIARMVASIEKFTANTEVMHTGFDSRIGALERRGAQSDLITRWAIPMLSALSGAAVVAFFRWIFG